MRVLSLIVLSFACSFSSYATEDYKDQIAIKLREIEVATGELKAEKGKELAHLYLKDQDQERAFEVFLKALDDIPPKSIEKLHEIPEYREALQLYLEQKGSPHETSKLILSKYLDIANANPHSSIGYLIAIAYANLQKYHEFFDQFYETFQNNIDHFLADKTKAILHIKLLERRRTEEGRSEERKEVLKYFETASKKAPADTTLYRLIIVFSPPDEKRKRLVENMNRIIDGDVKIPRNDLLFYVQESVDQEELEMAQKFVDRAKQWYPQSKIVDSAQNLIATQKKDRS